MVRELNQRYFAELFFGIFSFDGSELARCDSVLEAPDNLLDITNAQCNARFRIRRMVLQGGMLQYTGKFNKTNRNNYAPMLVARSFACVRYGRQRRQ